jgi:hypothetical protein
MVLVVAHSSNNELRTNPSKMTWIILRDDDIAQSTSDEQPEDEDRRRRVFLSLEVKTWHDEDLNHEEYLRIGLLLLINLIQGKTNLAATSRSMHSHYTECSRKSGNKVGDACASNLVFQSNVGHYDKSAKCMIFCEPKSYRERKLSQNQVWACFIP